MGKDYYQTLGVRYVCVCRKGSYSSPACAPCIREPEGGACHRWRAFIDYQRSNPTSEGTPIPLTYIPPNPPIPHTHTQ